MKATQERKHRYSPVVGKDLFLEGYRPRQTKEGAKQNSKYVVNFWFYQLFARWEVPEAEAEKEEVDPLYSLTNQGIFARYTG